MVAVLEQYYEGWKVLVLIKVSDGHLPCGSRNINCNEKKFNINFYIKF